MNPSMRELLIKVAVLFVLTAVAAYALTHYTLVCSTEAIAHYRNDSNRALNTTRCLVRQTEKFDENP